MGKGHKKSHHSHEVNDAYSEGWDAHKIALPGTGPVNPYRMNLEDRTLKQVAAQERDAELWDEGWIAYAEFGDA